MDDAADSAELEQKKFIIIKMIKKKKNNNNHGIGFFVVATLIFKLQPSR